MTPTRADQPKILLLSRSEATTASVLSLVDQPGQVLVVDSFQKAAEAIQSGRVDVVVSEAGDFLPGHCDRCARWTKKLLSSTGEGIAAIGLDGRVVWANATMTEMPKEVLNKVVEMSLEAVGRWAAPKGEAGPARVDVRQFSLADSTGVSGDYEVAISPVCDDRGQLIQVATVVRNVMAAHQLQQRLRDVEAAGQQLVRFDAEHFSVLSVPQRVEKIERQIASYIHSLMHFDRFSIRLVNRQSGRLAVAMAHGMSDCIFDREMTASEEGQGICGYVAATGRSYICPDTTRDHRYLPGIDKAGSSLTVPLWLHDEVIGVFNLESDQVADFDDVDRQLLEAFGRHLAIALKILDLLVIERYRTTGQLADDVSTEIAAPLNDIVTDASSLIAEHIDNPALVARLESILHNVERIRTSVREVARPINGSGKVLQKQKPAGDPLLSGKRILVADDEEVIRTTVYEVLRKQGCHVDTARDGAEAVNMISLNQYDMVLADIRMPFKNGYEVFAAVRSQLPACQVILITGFGYDPNHSIVRANREGLAAVLFKPFKVDQLLTEVRQALRRSPSSSAVVETVA